MSRLFANGLKKLVVFMERKVFSSTAVYGDPAGILREVGAIHSL
jgi:hypothetical protein